MAAAGLGGSPSSSNSSSSSPPWESLVAAVALGRLRSSHLGRLRSLGLGRLHCQGLGKLRSLGLGRLRLGLGVRLLLLAALLLRPRALGEMLALASPPQDQRGWGPLAALVALVAPPSRRPLA